MSNETLIGRGRIAEVFAWGDDQVLKLFYEGQALDWIKEEARISRLVYETGVATPAVGDVIEVEGRHGIIYGRVHGTSMLTELSSSPWKVFQSAKMLAKLHASMHEKKVTSLPSQRQNLQHSIQSASALTEQKKSTILKVLDSLPDDHRLCHGDFHPDNIVVSAHGAMVIDWTTASQGSPLADAARTSLILQMGELPPGAPLLIQWITCPLKSKRELIERGIKILKGPVPDGITSLITSLFLNRERQKPSCYSIPDKNSN